MSNPITVELPADLPTDWQQYQVVSPNGTEAGLDEQHGYNYLMEQVNNAQTAAKECGEALGDTVPASREINGHPLTDDVTLSAADVNAVPTTRTVNGKALSSNVTLTGADINVSGSDSTTVSAALSNKADVTTPQEYSIPLANGWVNYTEWVKSMYSKNQFNEVIVHLDVKNNGEVAQDSIIATLPVGYRPKNSFDVVALVYANESIGGARCFFGSSGQIKIAAFSQTPWTSIGCFCAEAVFIAAD